MVSFEAQLDTILTHDDDQFLWFHPRVAAIPGMGSGGAPRVVMTLQKHLRVSDHYSGLYTMRTDDLGATWSGPDERPELAWVESDDVHIAVCDVTTSDDGLSYGPIREWTFQDGTELGSYNTQQHWLAHDKGLCLTYTRRGADNDHIMRNRAPLFIAQVDPESLELVRETEEILIPERGATLGNFGAAPITPGESWVTASEGVWDDEDRERGATGATFVARVKWDTPNALAAWPASSGG